MEKIYKQTKKILADDVNMFRKLRLSTFLRWLQEISIAHTEELGQGRKKTLDKGVLWILARIKIEFFKIPCYDDIVEFSTWPSNTMHVLFPRNYKLTNQKGETIAKASAIWLLMDSKTRKMVFPEKYGVTINGVNIGEELSIPWGIESDLKNKDIKEIQNEQLIEFRDVDINQHLNSAKYLDYFDNILGKDFLEKNILKNLEIEYLDEAKLHDLLLTRTFKNKSEVFTEGSINNRPCFKLKAKFE